MWVGEWGRLGLAWRCWWMASIGWVGEWVGEARLTFGGVGCRWGLFD